MQSTMLAEYRQQAIAGPDHTQEAKQLQQQDMLSRDSRDRRSHPAVTTHT